MFAFIFLIACCHYLFVIIFLKSIFIYKECVSDTNEFFLFVRKLYLRHYTYIHTYMKDNIVKMFATAFFGFSLFEMFNLAMLLEPKSG